MLSNDVDGGFWGALWLELWPFEVLTCVFLHFSFFQVGFRHCHHVQSMHGAICYHNNKSAASEMPCGLSYGHFRIFMERIMKKGVLIFGRILLILERILAILVRLLVILRIWC